MACGVGAQGQVYLVKKAKTCPICDVTHREPQVGNKFFFYPNLKTSRIRRQFEHHSNSIGWWVMALKAWSKKRPEQDGGGKGQMRRAEEKTTYPYKQMFVYCRFCCVCGFVYHIFLLVRAIVPCTCFRLTTWLHLRPTTDLAIFI